MSYNNSIISEMIHFFFFENSTNKFVYIKGFVIFMINIWKTLMLHLNKDDNFQCWRNSLGSKGIRKWPIILCISPNDDT